MVCGRGLPPAPMQTEIAKPDRRKRDGASSEPPELRLGAPQAVGPLGLAVEHGEVEGAEHDLVIMVAAGR
jgi:hypothetical protein